MAAIFNLFPCHSMPNKALMLLRHLISFLKIDGVYHADSGRLTSLNNDPPPKFYGTPLYHSENINGLL